MDVAVYTRVSTKHEEQISSLENQKRHYEEYCKNHSYTLVKLYSDEGLSATSPNRKEFLNMMTDAGLDYEKDKDSSEILYFKASKREPKFNLIITKDVSRFSRNLDANSLVKKLRDKGVYILFENAGFSTQDKDYELRLGLLLTFSQQESIDRSNKVSFAYKHRSKQGIFHMTKNLYGYKYDPTTKEVSIVEDEAVIVRKMFEMYIEGNGVRNISNFLNENNIRTQNGKEWVGGNVRRLLRNEKYIGRVILNRYKNADVTSGNKGRSKRPENEWIIKEDAIPAIIDMNTWNKAQEIMQQRVNLTNPNSLTGTKKVKNIFYGKLFCGKCGKQFVRLSAKKTRKSGEVVTEINYCCANRRQRKSCNNKMISHKVLEQRIIDFGKYGLLSELETSKQLLLKLTNIQINLLLSKQRVSLRQTDAIKKQISDIDTQLDKLVMALVDSDSSVTSVIKRKMSELEDKRISLNNKILEYDSVTLENEVQELKKTVGLLTNLEIKDEYTFDETLKYLGKITVEDGEINFDVVADQNFKPLLNINPEKINSNKWEDLNKKFQETKQEIDNLMK
ncbi:recombinase family protein [Cytobacillus oceanisediminis]|uniref:recombinase family protein n=1 Tax=Cytobacillus oceanisediminis TaxID=665099 RepID=UPI0037365A3E